MVRAIPYLCDSQIYQLSLSQFQSWRELSVKLQIMDALHLFERESPCSRQSLNLGAQVAPCNCLNKPIES